MKQAKESLLKSIVQQREMLTGLLYEPLRQLADVCGQVWGDRAKMEAVLIEAFPSVPYCKGNPPFFMGFRNKNQVVRAHFCLSVMPTPY